MNQFFLDIETQRTDDPVVIKRLQDAVKPPGQYSKPESITKWHAEQGAAARLEAVNKTALDGTYGRLATIGFAVDDGLISVLDMRSFSHYETMLLGHFSDCLAEPQAIEIVAFNGEFDLRFLMKRYVINNLPVPFRIQSALAAKVGYYDPMRQWEGFRGYIAQADLECALGITRKDDIDGSQVGDAIDAGDWERVINHNREDIKNLRGIYKRMTA